MNVPFGFCHCGCGEKTKISEVTSHKYGYTRGQPIRFISGHSNKLNHTVQEVTGCWIWGGKLNGSGYATTTRNRKTVRLARWLYERTFGALPSSLHVDHLCRNRACINPYHLRAITPQENQRASPTLKLNPRKVRAIRERRANGESPYLLAKEFGIGRSYVWEIVTRKRWSDIDA